MVVARWLSDFYHFVLSDNEVQSRLWWVAGGSSQTFVPESPCELRSGCDGCHTSVFSLLSSSQFRKYSSLFSTKLVVAGPSQVPPGSHPFFLGNNAHSEKACSSPEEKKRAARAAPEIPNEKISIFSDFLSFSFIFFHFLFSFIFFHILFFSGAQNPSSFFASIASRFLLKALM